MSGTFDCPKCGGPLDVGEDAEKSVRCPYCNSAVIVPEALRTAPKGSAPINMSMTGLFKSAGRFKDIRDLAQSGNKVEAIKLYRELTNSDLATAKRAVDAMAAGESVVMQGGTFQSSETSYSTPSMTVGKTQKSLNRTIGCVGCGIAAFVVGIIAITTIIPLIIAGTALNSVDSSINQTLIPSLTTAMPNVDLPAVIPSIANEVLTFGSQGIGEGMFEDGRAIAVNPSNGDVFIAEYNPGKVQVFNAQGVYQRQWSVGDKPKDIYIGGMDVDRNNHVYVVAQDIYVYDATSGELLNTIEAGDNVSYHYDDVVVAPDGNLLALGDGDSIVRLSTDGKILDFYESLVEAVTDDSELDGKLAVDGAGNFYILGTFNNGVFKYSSDGKFLNRFGSDGDEPGQFRAPGAIAVDGQGRIYISDFKGVQIFDNDGRYLDVFDLDGFVHGLTFDDQGFLYAMSNLEKAFKFEISLP